MGICKTAVAFVILGSILGLAYCSGDGCGPEITERYENCLINMGATKKKRVNLLQEELEEVCRNIEAYPSCIAEATNLCSKPSVVSSAKFSLNKWTEDLSSLCKRLGSMKRDALSTSGGYSHASSTSVANIVLLIPALATLAPFMR